MCVARDTGTGVFKVSSEPGVKVRAQVRQNERYIECRIRDET